MVLERSVLVNMMYSTLSNFLGHVEQIEINKTCHVRVSIWDLVRNCHIVNFGIYWVGVNTKFTIWQSCYVINFVFTPSQWIYDMTERCPHQWITCRCENTMTISRCVIASSALVYFKSLQLHSAQLNFQIAL